MDNNNLLEPLLLPPTTTASGTANPAACTPAAKDATVSNPMFSGTAILFRLLSVFFIGIISVWANYEASRGFRLTIVNDAGDTAAGRKFDLFYVSNDKATRLVLNASGFVEKLLYDPANNSHPKKDVGHVILRLAGRNLTNTALVSPRGKHEFALDISSSVMEGTGFHSAMAAAVQRGMARIWLWDGDNSAPPPLLEGMVEYISILAGFSPAPTVPESVVLAGSEKLCWMKKDPVFVAHFLNYCEAEKIGFIQRLNQAMKYQWNEGAFDSALGYPVEELCASYDKVSKV